MNRHAIETIIFASAAFIAAAMPSCRRHNEARERIQAEREAWEASLPDSLKAIERQTDSIKREIETLTENAAALLPAFDYVENPREVEGYYMAKAWTPEYPLAGTGLVMRITKGEKAEIIAALAGGAHFNRIRVTAGDAAAESGTVPHDQALNYRMAGLNTVCFSDSASDACARLIAEHRDSPVTIIYLDGDRQTGKLSYPEKSRATLGRTWDLYDTRSRIRRDERMIPLLAKKGAIINSRIESLKGDKDK